MQSMNTDQQTYYPNTAATHPVAPNFYMQNSLEPFAMSNSNAYGPSTTMNQPYYNPPMTNMYPPMYLPHPPFLQHQQYHPNAARGQSQSYVPVIRPPNETSNGTQAFIPVTTYPNSNLQQAHMYPQTSYYRFSMPQAYPQSNYPSQTSAAPLSSQSQSQSPYPTANNQQQTQTTQASQLSNIDQQGILHSQSKEKRQKKPIPIVDPISQKTLDIKASTPPHTVLSTTTATTVTDESRQRDSLNDTTNTNSKPKNETTQKQDEFRKQFARLLVTNNHTDKNGNQSSPDDQVDGKSTKEQQQTEDATIKSTSSSRSGSVSRSKSPISIQSIEPVQPGIPVRNIIEDTVKSEVNETETEQVLCISQDQPETIKTVPDDTVDDATNKMNHESLSKEEISSQDSKSTIEPELLSIVSNAEPFKSVISMLKRHSYTKEELLNKRADPNAQKRPIALKPIEGVTYVPTIRPGSTTIPRESIINLDPTPLTNRSNNPYMPADPRKIDVNEKFLREIKAILNKVTPQTYDKLLKQLDDLELDRLERLDGMIANLFSKAVDEPAFCFLYAKLCQHFQKKQVTVPDENGQRLTHSFRQILLTRCQKEFENDYRQEIGYEKRKSEVEAMSDEKVQKEEAEKLEENLAKAKRKKLGNIFFIGELFKLQMLTDMIMYDCIDYLLRDKTDEESLECLCRLLRTIGKELDAKTSDKKAVNRKNLEKNYVELDNIITQRQTSARIRFMIQDIMDLRKANWVARRAEAKPMTIDEIHEQERIRREQQERDQERDRAQRRDQNRGGGGSNYGGNPQQYTDSRGSRGSGMKQSNRTSDEQNASGFNVNSVRQLQSNDKRNQGPIALNLAPQGAWSKGSAVEKKTESDRTNVARNGKPPTGPSHTSKTKLVTSTGSSDYSLPSQTSRELIRDYTSESARKLSSGGVTSPSNVSVKNSREGSRNVSREQSRDSHINEQLSNTNMVASSNKTSTAINSNLSKTPFDEEKTIARVHSLIEEYTENYSDTNDRAIKEAVEDLVDFVPSNSEQQAIIIRELFTNVLELKPRARKAIGNLLDTVLHKNIITEQAFLFGVKMVIELVPDFSVDIPLVWQYIGEIFGAFVGGPLSNMLLLKPILKMVPDEKTKQLFQYIMRYAIELSSKLHIQKLWQSSGFSLSDLIKSDSIDPAFINEYSWLAETIGTEKTTSTSVKENNVPRADLQLVKLFKSVNDQGTTVSDAEIIRYIETHMNPSDKFFIRNIVLSYLEACLINREPQKKIQEDIAKTRMTVLNHIIDHRQEAETQAVYAIQNFVHKLEHPPKMAQLLFDIFYDEECVSEDSFFEWRRHSDPSETEGHAVVEMSTKDFFNWLEQADTEAEEGEVEEEGEEEES